MREFMGSRHRTQKKAILQRNYKARIDIYSLINSFTEAKIEKQRRNARKKRGGRGGVMYM